MHGLENYEPWIVKPPPYFMEKPTPIKWVGKPKQINRCLSVMDAKFRMNISYRIVNIRLPTRKQYLATMMFWT